MPSLGLGGLHTVRVQVPLAVPLGHLGGTSDFSSRPELGSQRLFFKSPLPRLIIRLIGSFVNKTYHVTLSYPFYKGSGPT
jgi:hypothetical protein